MSQGGNMDILPNEVESVRTIGSLFGEDVRMVKTHGGFHVAVGKKKKKKKKVEALAAGSHQAVVAHQLSKEYGSDFQPAIFKSEQEKLEAVEDKTQYLPSDAIANGVELYTLSKGNRFEFLLYKRGLTLGRYETEAQDKALVIKKFDFSNIEKSDRSMAEAISRAMRDKVHELNLERIEKGYL